MLNLFELPPGFKVTLFAGKPDVQQPIAFDFDDHGRIWVAENYTYSARAKIDQVMRDRVIILHDKDGDGEHDERKVFWDKGRMLTGLTWGYGGLWILNDGTLSVPDFAELCGSCSPVLLAIQAKFLKILNNRLNFPRGGRHHSPRGPIGIPERDGMATSGQNTGTIHQIWKASP